MILFLDFDDTLHPTWTFDEREDQVTAHPYQGPWLVSAPILERILLPHLPNIEIVISSWWAYKKGIEPARRMLPEDLAERVTGSIWLREMSCDYRSALCTRYGCIKGWLDRRRPGYDGPWIALDDDSGWPAEERHRLVHARGTLAIQAVQDALAEKLAATFRAMTGETDAGNGG